METPLIVKSTQEQASAAWIDHLNQLRLDDLLSNLAIQDTNLAGALQELQKLKEFVGDPAHILGSALTKHGEIAEHAQVNISNARKMVEGLKAEYTFKGVGRTAPEDYLHNGAPIQSKFVQNELGLKAIKEHFEKYPDFIKNGGKYQIPKDFFTLLQKYATMSPEQGNRLAGAERTMYVAVQKFLKESGIELKDVKPTVVNYGDVQRGKINETIDNENQNIKSTDETQREKFYDESKPTLREGAKATVVSAAIEGGMSFCLGVAKKLKSGKKLEKFTAEDWKDIGIDTAKGTGKGAVRGTTVYALTNFTATPAAVASALVTASFGMAAQAKLLREGKITPESFIENSEVVCLDVTVSAIASVMGQVLIPIPVLGAIIGNAIGMFMHGIAKDNLSREEQALIYKYNIDLETLNAQLDKHYKVLIDILKQEFSKYKSAVELAFNLDVNIAFAGSVGLAQYVGCSQEKILTDKAAVDTFFLN